MILDHSFPREIKYAQEKNIPLVIVGGTVEYHGPHCAYGQVGASFSLGPLPTFPLSPFLNFSCKTKIY